MPVGTVCLGLVLLIGVGEGIFLGGQLSFARIVSIPGMDPEILVGDVKVVWVIPPKILKSRMPSDQF